MLKVLLVDDEPAIREGLKTIIDWGKYGFYICGEAVDGEGGLKKILELHPDLVIVDIKMPGMDGIKMIQESKNLSCMCKFIILSGYSEFEHAKQAIEFGVNAYLLKPIDEDELAKKVKEVYEEINTDKKTKKMFMQSVSLSKDKIIENLVLGELNMELISICMETYHLDLIWDSYEVILINLQSTHPAGNKVRNNIRSDITEIVDEYGLGYVFETGNNFGILSKYNHHKRNSAPFTKLLKKLNSTIDIDVTIAVGKKVKNIIDIPVSYETAKELLDKKFLYGPEKILMVEEIRNKYKAHETDNINKLHIAELIEKLYIAIDVNNKKSIQAILDNLKGNFISYHEVEEKIKINYMNVYSLITNKLKIKHEGGKDFLIPYEQVAAEIYSKKNIQDLHRYILEEFERISEQLDQSRADSTMKKILDYIERNYNEDLKLKVLADVFSYNSAYLGRMFKNFTGEYFNNYLDRIRIDKAKELLKGDLKVYEVSERVGYRNTDYFYSKFRKYAGTSPSVYKKKLKK
ncbi:MAG: two component transcriptional regulator, AraC family [Clostridia bacterium]|jgi:two-component system response regulator YesN|nr:two component transcriptional regulator, AraC family [Clostridia bacterium]